MSADETHEKTPQELFETVIKDSKILELLREACSLLGEHGLDKDNAIDYVIAVLIAGYTDLDHLVCTLEAIKMSYIMPTVQLMSLASELVTKDETESALKPV